MKIKLKIYYFDILFGLIMAMPIIDFINGFLYEKISFIGQLYRMITITVAGIAIFYYGKRKEQKFLIIFGVLFIMHDLLFILFDGDNNPISILNERTLKYIYTIVIILALISLVKCGKIAHDKIEETILYYSWTYPILLIIPKLIGASNTYMYSESGYKGFFYSGNAISITMVVMLFISMNELYKKQNSFNIIRCCLNLISQLLIGAKTNYFCAILIAIYFVIKAIKKLNLNGFKNVLLIFFIVCIGLYAITNTFASEISAIIARQNYLYQGVDGNIISYLTSNRSPRISSQWNMYISNLFYILFGMGYRKGIINNFVEMDYIDLLFRYGLVITLVYILFLCGIIIKSNKKSPYFFLLLIILSFSMFAGHVINDAMAGCLFALIICKCYSENVNKCCK